MSSSSQVAMLKDFRKDEDLVKKTFSDHAGVFQPINTLA